MDGETGTLGQVEPIVEAEPTPQAQPSEPSVNLDDVLANVKEEDLLKHPAFQKHVARATSKTQTRLEQEYKQKEETARREQTQRGEAQRWLTEWARYTPEQRWGMTEQDPMLPQKVEEVKRMAGGVPDVNAMLGNMAGNILKTLQADEELADLPWDTLTESASDIPKFLHDIVQEATKKERKKMETDVSKIVDAKFQELLAKMNKGAESPDRTGQDTIVNLGNDSDFIKAYSEGKNNDHARASKLLGVK